MSFKFDVIDDTPIDPWECAVRDRLPVNHTEADYHKEAAKQMINEIYTKKKPETIRKNLWWQSRLLQRMSVESPHLHDLVLAEFTERMNALVTDIPDVESVLADPANTRAGALVKEDNHGF